VAVLKTYSVCMGFTYAAIQRSMRLSALLLFISLSSANFTVMVLYLLPVCECKHQIASGKDQAYQIPIETLVSYANGSPEHISDMAGCFQ